MKIMYIHGLGGSATGQTVELLKKNFPDDEIIAPEYRFSPHDAILDIETMYYEEKPDIVIGCSLGGFYASMLGGCYKILVNPAYNAGDDIKKYIGIKKFTVGENECDITKEFIDQLNFAKSHFRHYYFDNDFKKETICLFANNDELFGANRKVDYEKIYGEHSFIEIAGTHRLTDDMIKTYIVKEINKLR